MRDARVIIVKTLQTARYCLIHFRLHAYMTCLLFGRQIHITCLFFGRQREVLIGILCNITHKPRCNLLRSRDCPADDRAERSALENLPKVFRVMDLSLCNYRNRKLRSAFADQFEIRSFQMRRILRITAHRSGDNVKSHLLCSQAFLKGRAVCHGKPACFMDPVNKLFRENTARPLSACRIHRYDLCSGSQEFLDFLHCGRDVDFAVIVITLHDSDDRQMAHLRNRVYVRNGLGAYACCPALHRGHCHPGHDVA